MCVTQKASSVFHREQKSENFSLLSSEIFWPLSFFSPKKTFSLSKAREWCVVTFSDRLVSSLSFRRE